MTLRTVSGESLLWRRWLPARLPLLCLLAAALVALGAIAAPARASSLPGPSSLSTGFGDSFTLQDAVAPARGVWLSRAQSIGSSFVRILVTWAAIAPVQPATGVQAADPSDPAYNWSSLDAQIEDSVAHTQNVLLTLLAPPKWALGSHAPASAVPGTWRPSASALGAFAHAVAERYSGHFPDPVRLGQSLPRVRYFQAWNEPNLPIYLSPQWTRGRHGGWLPASPAIYRAMLNAVYANVKAVQPGATVLAAGTAPYGDPPGVNRMAPVVFWRELLCLSGAALRQERCPNPVHFDALDHHPYAFTPTIHAFDPDGVSVPDLGRITRIVRVAQRTHRVLPAGPKPFWITEIDWGSNPPDRSAIPLSTQARYVSLAFYELWRQGVSHVFWLLIRDYPAPRLDGYGVYFRSGAAKPSAQAFRFPFVALPAGHRVVTLWGRAPAAGVVSIERRSGRRWRTVARLATTRAGIFYARRRLGSRLVLRAQLGASASLGWSTG